MRHDKLFTIFSHEVFLIPDVKCVKSWRNVRIVRFLTYATLTFDNFLFRHGRMPVKPILRRLERTLRADLNASGEQ